MIGTVYILLLVACAKKKTYFIDKKATTDIDKLLDIIHNPDPSK